MSLSRNSREIGHFGEILLTRPGEFLPGTYFDPFIDPISSPFLLIFWTIIWSPREHVGRRLYSNHVKHLIPLLRHFCSLYVLYLYLFYCLFRAFRPGNRPAKRAQKGYPDNTARARRYIYRDTPRMGVANPGDPVPSIYSKPPNPKSRNPKTQGAAYGTPPKPQYHNTPNTHNVRLRIWRCPQIPTQHE